MKLTPREFFCHAAAIWLGLCITVFGVMLLDRSIVVELDVAQSSVSPDPAIAGQTIAITWSAKARRNCDGLVIPRIIDSAGRIYEFARIPTVYQDIMRPGERSFTKSIVLPAGMTPGPARYESIVIRWCNSVQEYFWPMIDPPFPIPFDVER